MVSTSAMRRLRAVFLRPLHSRSRRLQQTKNATRHAQTRVFAGYGAFSGKEPDREQREKTGPNDPETGTIRGVALKRPTPGTAPTLALRAEKNPTDKGWVFKYWWRNTELNPRPCMRLFRKALFLRTPASIKWPFCILKDRLNQPKVATVPKWDYTVANASHCRVHPSSILGTAP